jgi:hypothetical protein
MGRPDPFSVPVRWTRTDDAEFPYRAEIEGETWTIRVNDWPDDPTVYTLLIGEEATDFNDWPGHWKRPH